MTLALEAAPSAPIDARPAALIDDLPLFSAARAAPPPPPAQSALAARLAEVEPDALSPRAALDLVYALKALSAQG